MGVYLYIDFILSILSMSKGLDVADSLSATPIISSYPKYTVKQSPTNPQLL